MPSNVTLNAGVGGATAVTRQITNDGDVAQLQGVFVMGITGVEDAYTAAAINGDETNGLDCDVTRVIPGTGATNLGKAEDTAHASGDTGVLALAVRRDTPAVGSNTDGDNSTLNVNSVGRLYTTATIDSSIPAGNNNIGDVDVASIAAGDNNIGNVDVLTLPELPTGNNNIGDVDIASIAAGDNNIGNVDVLTLPSIPAGNNNIGDVDIASIAAGNNNIGDVDVASIAAGDNNIGNVDIVTMPNVTLASTTNTIEVVGDVAQDAAVAGNPVLVGLRASTAVPTAMSGDGDAVYAWADRNGATVVAGRIVDDAAFTPGTDRVSPIAFIADETATDSVDEGDAGAARMTLDRKVITTPYAHAAAGGATPYKNIDVDEAPAQIKGSAGKLFWMHVVNLATSVRYLKLYDNVAASVTVGTTVPTQTFPIPTQGDNNGAGYVLPLGIIGLQFTTGITIAATTGLADNNAGAPGANEVVVNAGYL